MGSKLKDILSAIVFFYWITIGIWQLFDHLDTPVAIWVWHVTNVFLMLEVSVYIWREIKRDIRAGIRVEEFSTALLLIMMGICGYLVVTSIVIIIGYSVSGIWHSLQLIFLAAVMLMLLSVWIYEAIYAAKMYFSNVRESGHNKH